MPGSRTIWSRTVFGIDRFGRKHKLTADGFFARAVCHELDHLDGILYTDLASELYDIPPED